LIKGSQIKNKKDKNNFEDSEDKNDKGNTTSNNPIIVESKRPLKKQKDKKIKYNKNKRNKNSKAINLNINNIDYSVNFENNNNNMIETNKKSKNIRIRNKIKTQFNKTINIDQLKKAMEFNNEELNELPYNLAKQYDKRTYCQYYASLLKTKHSFIFSFINNDDYNSKVIKIDLFFNVFTLNYLVNALFYNDDTMHNIYVNKGSFDFVYQLPKIIYSSLISMVLNILLNLLALSNDEILKFKNNKSSEKIEKEKTDLNKKLKIKFALYFIVSFVLLLFCWYYLSMFGAIYRNTQYHLLKDTLISFMLSLIYPFGIYLLPGIIRIRALSKNENEGEFMYNISKIIQMF